MKTTPQAASQRNPRTYVLRPFAPAAPALAGADPATALVAAILPAASGAPGAPGAGRRRGAATVAHDNGRKSNLQDSGPRQEKTR